MAFIEFLDPRRLLSASPALNFDLVNQLRPGTLIPATSSAPVGMTPAQLKQAYGFGTIQGDGTGQTIAVVDAYDAPTAAADLAAFDKAFGLPAPPSFKRIAQDGTTNYPITDPRGAGNANGTWEEETALDLEWAHAAAPGASLILVEANSSSTLFTAVDEARSQPGVAAISMSFFGPETSGIISNDSVMKTPAGHTGETFVASSGDFGAFGRPDSSSFNVGYPASSPNVLAVGGTTLKADANGAYTSEAGWGNGSNSFSAGGSGGGISNLESQPAYQKGVVTQSTTQRTVPDVAFDADPASGVAVYDSWDFGSSVPWIKGAGTSLGAPVWAGIIAIADQGRVAAGKTSLDGATQTLPMLYGLPASDFHDITTGNNGYAAGAGYDLVTGRGTPIANLIVAGLGGGVASSGGNPIIVDNTQATLVGAWTASTYNSGFFGSNYINDGNAGKGTKSATFTPTIPTTGQYQVLARWPASTDRATNVPYIVTSASGTTTVTENEQQNNNTWVSLGTYTFNAGAAGNVKISNTGTNGRVVADAVEFVPVSSPPASTIVDNLQANLTGTWTPSTFSPGYYGTNYINDGNTGKGTKSAQFTPSLPSAGNYNVLVRWISGTDRATNVPISVVSLAGTTTLTENEQLDGTQWILLGTFSFNAGSAGSVTISNTGTNGRVIADAVEFVKV